MPEPPKPTCATCMFWTPPPEGIKYGSCHRRAPKALPHYDDYTDDFAPVEADNFCGDHPAFPAYLAELARAADPHARKTKCGLCQKPIIDDRWTTLPGPTQTAVHTDCRDELQAAIRDAQNSDSDAEGYTMAKKAKTKGVPLINAEDEFQTLIAAADVLASIVENLREATTLEEVEKLIAEILEVAQDVYTAATSWEPSDITGDAT